MRQLAEETAKIEKYTFTPEINSKSRKIVCAKNQIKEQANGLNNELSYRNLLKNAPTQGREKDITSRLMKNAEEVVDKKIIAQEYFDTLVSLISHYY